MRFVHFNPITMLNQLVVLVLLSTAVWAAIPKLRIIGGTDTQKGTNPYIVSIRVGPYHRHICGGSIIDQYHVLTAAQCLVGSAPSDLSVQYGVTTITDGLNTSKNVVKVSKLIVHDQYYAVDEINDIGIVKLASPIVFDNKTVKSVTLPEAFSPTPGYNVKAHLAGWGLSYAWGSITRHLQETDLNVYNDENCEGSFQNFAIVTDRRYHICAGVSEGGKGLCDGDLGGPLTIEGTQIGIASFFVKPCGLKGYPSVFTKVSNHVNWINTQISEDDDEEIGHSRPDP